MTTEYLKEKLLSEGFVVDNEYLDRYVHLMCSNVGRIREVHKTQRHHITPRYYYKHTKSAVDNSEDNIINLLFKDHIIAHCYLMLCSSNDSFSVKNYVSLFRMGIDASSGLSSILDSATLSAVQKKYESCEKINPMFVEKHREKHDRIMKDPTTRKKISDTMKKKMENGELFTDETRRKLSEIDKNMLYIHKDGVYTKVNKEDLERFLNDGWIRGNRPLTEEHKEALLRSLRGRKISEETRQKMRESHIGKKPKNVVMTEERRDAIRKSLLGRKWVNNGTKEICVKKEDVQEYIRNGYSFGRIKTVERNVRKRGDAK